MRIGGWMAAALVPLLAAASSAEGELSALAFMSGCWRGEYAPGRTIEERWTPADSDLMLATTRYLHDGRTVGWEFSRIEADSSGIALTPYPLGEMSVSFALVRSEDGFAVFENLAHDFPRRIIYRRDGDALIARIEGGEPAREWRMAAEACGPS